MSTLKNEDLKIRQDSITKLLTDVQLMKGKQKSLGSRLLGTKHKNEAPWPEVSRRRPKDVQQQNVVSELIQVLIWRSGTRS